MYKSGLAHSLCGATRKELAVECVLHISATDSTELISVAGGWLCDRAMAGWAMTVRVPSLDHARSLAILGIAAHEIGGHDDLATDALVFTPDAGRVLASDRFIRVRHHVSVAARAYRARAFRAADLSPSTVDIETFWLSAQSGLSATRSCVSPLTSAAAR